MHRVFHRADLQPLEVRRALDGALAVGHVAETVFLITEDDEALFLQVRVELLSELSIDGVEGRFSRREEVRQVEDLYPLVEAGERRSRRYGHLNRSHLHALAELAVAAELRVGVKFHLDLALGSGFYVLRERLHRLHRRVRLRSDVADLDRVLRSSGRRARRHDSDSRHYRKNSSH